MYNIQHFGFPKRQPLPVSLPQSAQSSRLLPLPFNPLPLPTLARRKNAARQPVADKFVSSLDVVPMGRTQRRRCALNVPGIHTRRIPRDRACFFVFGRRRTAPYICSLYNREPEPVSTARHATPATTYAQEDAFISHATFANSCYKHTNTLNKFIFV